MSEHDYDQRPFEFLPLKEQLKQAGLLEQELEKMEAQRPSLDEIKESVASNKQHESKKWRFKDGALNYFNNHKDIYKFLSRKQLRKVDDGLYCALRKEGTLEAAIPKTIRRDFSDIDPVAYFKKHHAHRCQTVTDLFKRDQTLYKVLHKKGILNGLLDKNQYTDYKNNPLEIFRSDPEYNGLTRTQLNKKNRALYRALHYHNQMDEAIPVKNS
ncbi:MAG: hypothetical protein ACOCUR_02585 [Nanoarchaeota archaeon]